MKVHSKIALTYFILAAVFGVVLRSIHSFDTPINYKFIVHTHSHLALLGWVYVALTTLIYTLFVQSPLADKKYHKLFWFTQLTLIGMLLTFPFQGYALFSIIFSTSFLFASYWFAWFFFRNVTTATKISHSYKCIKASLWYLVLSSLGPWALGAIMNTLGADSIWYRMAIYYYLHFLYNGWMIMAIVGILFYTLEQHRISLSEKTFKRFFCLLNLGIVLSFFLSTLFAHPPIGFNILGGLGAFLQLSAFGILALVFVGQRSEIHAMFSAFQRRIYYMVGFLMAVKILLQMLTSISYFTNLATTFLDFTIGYLHWTFLGIVTLSLFLFFDYFGLMKISRKAYLLYLFGFILTEILIFYKGIAAWQAFPIFEGYFELLSMGSLLIPLSLVLILVGNRRLRSSM